MTTGLLLGLEYENQYDPRVRDELEQLMAAIQTAFNRLGIEFDPTQQPRAAIYHSTTQSLTSSADTALSFDSEDDDPFGFHSVSTNTTQLVVPAGLGGNYLLIGTATFAASSTNARQAFWKKNGSTNIGSKVSIAPPAGGAVCTVQVTTYARLNELEYVELIANQDSGGPLNSGSATRLFANQAVLLKVG